MTAAAAGVQQGRGLGARLGRLIDRYSLLVYTGLAVIYLMLPVALIIVFSFNNPAGKSNVVWQGFTLKYWLNPLGVDGLPEAVWLSLVIAFLSTLIATALGTLIALALVRYDFRGRRVTNALIFLPMATPEIILGASLADVVRGDRQPAVLPAWVHDDPDRAHHVLHQLRRGHGPGTVGRLPAPPRGGGDGPLRERDADVLESRRSRSSCPGSSRLRCWRSASRSTTSW